MAVHRPGPTLTAAQCTELQRAILLPDGTLIDAHPGDWLITDGTLVVTCIRAKTFPAPFALVPGEGALVLTAADRTRLEATTGIGSTRTPAEFVRAVEFLASIRIGDVKLEFTPGQLSELQHRATKRGQTIAQAIQAVVDRIREEIFWRS